jgi:hypothetical protein
VSGSGNETKIIFEKPHIIQVYTEWNEKQTYFLLAIYIISLRLFRKLLPKG